MLRPHASVARVRALLREQRYRRQFFDGDRKQSVLAMVGITGGFCLAVRNDLILLRGTALRVALLCRLGAVIALVVALAFLRGAKRPRQHDRIFARWLAVWSLLAVLIVPTRWPTGEHLGPLAGQAALIGVLYFGLWGSFAARVSSAAITTAATLALLWAPATRVSPAAHFTSAVLLVATNLGALVVTRASEENRRKRFEAERALAVKVRELAVEKDRAEATSRARAALLAAVSHEFRTPMNAVIGLSELVLDTPLSADNQHHVRTIHDSARALLALLEEILDFAKIDADRIDLSPAPFDLRRLAASVVDMLRPAAGARSLSLSLDVSPSVPAALVGDDARLRQVLVNLVSNGIKFTERGRVELRVAARALGGDDHEICFRVEDTGIGMSADAMARLFRPFEQGDQGIARRYGGAGLGLAISKKIVTAMGGDIHVESAPARGSVFSFTLRLAATAPLPEVAPAAERAARAPLAILVVDDHPINRDVARAKLHRLGYALDLASDGPEAILAVSKKSYDVVLMDLSMPGMSGIEATKRILEGLAGREAPHVIAMTASVFEEDREACRRVGMRDFVGKPIDMKHLDAVLRWVAEERGAVPPVLSREALAKVQQIDVPGEPGFFKELCRIFGVDARARLSRIEDALEREDAAALQSEAHVLRSASATLGATEMADLCGRIEVGAREGRVAEVGAWVRALSSQIEVVERALAREVA